QPKLTMSPKVMSLRRNAPRPMWKMLAPRSRVLSTSKKAITSRPLEARVGSFVSEGILPMLGDAAPTPTGELRWWGDGARDHPHRQARVPPVRRGGGRRHRGAQ